jgi:hypothetical protein
VAWHRFGQSADKSPHSKDIENKSGSCCTEPDLLRYGFRTLSQQGVQVKIPCDNESRIGTKVAEHSMTIA